MIWPWQEQKSAGSLTRTTASHLHRGINSGSDWRLACLWGSNSLLTPRFFNGVCANVGLGS